MDDVEAVGDKRESGSCWSLHSSVISISWFELTASDDDNFSCPSDLNSLAIVSLSSNSGGLLAVQEMLYHPKGIFCIDYSTEITFKIQGLSLFSVDAAEIFIHKQT